MENIFLVEIDQYYLLVNINIYFLILHYQGNFLSISKKYFY